MSYTFQAHPVKCNKSYRRYTADAMLQAYDAVTKKGVSVHRASVQFHVPTQTLRDRVNGTVDAHNLHLGSEAVFTSEEEQPIVEHLKTMSLLGYGLTNVKLQQLGGELAAALGKRPTDKQLSNKWLYGFLKRHSHTIASLKPSGLDTNRAKSSTPEAVDSYFTNLEGIMVKYNLSDKPQYVFNVDETGIQPEHRPPNVIAPVGQKTHSVTSPRSTTTTVIGCVSAAGSSLPPYYVFKGKRLNPELLKGSLPGSKGVMSDSGWSNGELFKVYLEDHFLPNLPCRADDQHILLILDGHTSHISTSLIEWAKSHNIILFVLPAHTSHLLQPLDVGVFGPFKKYYYSECATYMRENIGQKITKYEMCELSGKAYLKSMTPVNITSSFRRAGIFPLNRDAVPKEKLFASEGFRDETPVQKVAALLSGKDAIAKYLQEKAEKGSKKPNCNCKCTCNEPTNKEVISKPKPGGKAITEQQFISDMEIHQNEKENINPSSKKISKNTSSKKTKTPKSKKTIPINHTTCPKPSTSGILSKRQPKVVITYSDSETDMKVEYNESTDCCVCRKFSPPNLNDRPHLKIVTWVDCDKCGHWVHLTFCTTQRVIRRGDTFLCPHCIE